MRPSLEGYKYNFLITFTWLEVHFFATNLPFILSFLLSFHFLHSSHHRRHHRRGIASQQKLTQKIHHRSTVKSSNSPSLQSSSLFPVFVMVGIGLLVLSFLVILVVSGYRCWTRSKRKNVSSNHFYTVDMNYGSGPDAKVSTPVYCEPDRYDWRNTHHPHLPQLSSSVRHQPQYIPIHEYAVPEVVYKQTSPTIGPTIVNTSSTSSRIINNPLQEVVDSIHRLKASYGISSSPVLDRDVNSVSSGADECLISTKDSITTSTTLLLQVTQLPSTHQLSRRRRRPPPKTLLVITRLKVTKTNPRHISWLRLRFEGWGGTWLKFTELLITSTRM